MEYADNAYVSVGQSATDYLDQVNSFSVSLKNSLNGDTDAAADLANEIVEAEADIYASGVSMGNSLENVQNAFTGILRNNYTMLDNLNIGINPTKEGFEEMIDTVNEWNAAQGEATNYTMDNYADMYSALVDYVEMVGLAGYSSAEAGSTIQGSAASTKAAWDNLVTGLSDDNADLDQLIENFTTMLVGNGDNITGYIELIVPKIESAMNGVSELIEKLVPIIVDKIPSYIENTLPSLLESAEGIVTAITDGITNNIDKVEDAAEQIISSIGNTLSTIGSSLVDNMDSILNAAGDLLEMLSQGIVDNADELVNGAFTIVNKLSGFLMDNLDLLLEAAGSLLDAILDGISNNIEGLASGAVTIVTKLVGFITDHIDKFVDTAVKIVTTLATELTNSDNVSKLLNAGLELVVTLGTAILENLDEIIAIVDDIVIGILDALTEEGNVEAMKMAFIELFAAFGEAVPDILSALWDVLKTLVEYIVEYWTGGGKASMTQAALTFFGVIPTALAEVFASLMVDIASKVVSLVLSVTSKAGEMLSAAQSFFGGLVTGFTEKVSEITTAITTTVTGWINAVTGTVSQWTQIGVDLINGLWTGFSSKISSVKDSIVNFASGVASAVKDKLQISSPSKVFAEIGGFMAEGLEQGWEDNIDAVNKNITDGLKYEGEIDVATNLRTATTATSTTNLLSNSDISKLAEALSIHFTNITEIDGKAIKQESYDYMVQQIGNESRGVRVAQGGYY